MIRLAAFLLDERVQPPALTGSEPVESFEHPENTFPAQAGQYPAFYHLPWVRLLDRFLVVH
jgi:hypothetical protein